MLLLDCVRVDDVDKLRGCHLTTKDDPSVFIDPVIPDNDLHVGVVTPAKRQWMLDRDYSGFHLHPNIF